MERQGLAELTALAFNKPEALADERREAEQSARAPAADDVLRAAALRMFAELDRGRVMEA